MKPLAALLCLLAATKVLGLEPFSASYQLSLENQLKGITHFNLKIDDSGQNYDFEAFTRPDELTSSQDGTHEILESSRGQLVNEQVIPNSYYYAVRKQGGTRMLEFFFQWKHQLVLYRDEKTQEKFKLEPNTQDRLSYLLQAMQFKRLTQSFPRLDIDGQKQVKLTRKPQRYITTPLGRFLAQPIEIEVEGEARSRTLWLAAKQGHVPLLLEKPTPAGVVKMEILTLDRP